MMADGVMPSLIYKGEIRVVRGCHLMLPKLRLMAAGALAFLATSSALCPLAHAQTENYWADQSGADAQSTSNGNSGAGAASLSDTELQSEVDRSLSDAAAVAQQSIADMMASEGAGTTQNLQPVNISSLPTELQRPVTVAWTGPAEQLVQRVAQGIGYSYTETGTPPVVPDMVVVRYNNQPAAIVLQDLGLRISKVAQISIDTTARTIAFVNDVPQVAPLEPPAPSSAAPSPVAHHYHHLRAPTSPTIDGYPKSLFLSGK